MYGLNLKEDLDAAIMLIENPRSPFQVGYDCYCLIYNIPTINHKELFKKIEVNWNSYLGVAGSNDPLLNAVSLGVKKATIFDINHLNFYFTFLLIAGVLALEYDEYLKYFYYSKDHAYLSKFYFDKLKNELPLDIKKFWEQLYHLYSPTKLKNLFLEDLGDKKNQEYIERVIIPNNIFLNEKEFYLLKKKLLQLKLNCLAIDFEEFPRTGLPEKYDFIYLSCMQEFTINQQQYFEKVKEYEQLLKPNGVILGGFIYYQNLQKQKKFEQENRELFKENGYKEIYIPIALNYQEDIALIKKRSIENEN